MRIVNGKTYFPALVWRRGMTYRCAEGSVKAQAGDMVRCGMDGDAIANSLRLGYIHWQWVEVAKPAKLASRETKSDDAPAVKEKAKTAAKKPAKKPANKR